MKVLLLSKYPRQGASSRLRSLQYLPALTAAGIEVTVSSLFDERYLQALYGSGRRQRLRPLLLYLKRLLQLPGVFRYDLIWIEKELFPYAPAWFERLLSRAGVRYVVDYDDAIFHNYDLAGSRVLRKVLGHKIDTVMASAECVIAGNQYLAKRARQAGAARVEMIPTVVDHTRYPQARSATSPQVTVPQSQIVGQGMTGKQRVIGWIGSPSTQRYVVEIKAALQQVCERLNARLMLVGAADDVVAQLAGIPVEVVPWSEDTEARSIACMDVGIMPLVDGPWERGKCGYKLIQYMASGVPVVASAVGVNIEIVSGSRCGRLVQSIDEWATALQELLVDPQLRHTLGRAGRDRVEKKYSLDAQAPLLAGILKSTVR